MHEVYFDRSRDYDDYALGDLSTSAIIRANADLWRRIWQSLDVGHVFREPKLTVGASVADLLQARIAELVGANLDTPEERERLANATTRYHNAAYLARLARDKDPASLLGKCDGGRCRNAKPVTLALSGSLADIDIGGAYASAMTATPLVFGSPRVTSYGNARDLNADLKDCPTLAEWLRRHEHQLVDRTWIARISTREPFTFDSDLIPSWIDFRVTAGRSDSEIAGLDILTDPASGEMRYFTREIHAGMLTSDLLDVARVTMSVGQFAEFSSKVVVRAGMFFDEKDRIGMAEFREGFQLGTLSEYAWAGMTLGEMISDVARGNRMEQVKGSPLNSLFKLVSNTAYGVSVSRHFAASSVIAGNNVTATVRAFTFLAEKGLNLVGSVTDGQLFDLNRVLHPRTIVDKRRPLAGNRRLSDIAMGTRAYRLSRRELKDSGAALLAPLIGQKIETRDRKSVV
jgi:hypothetical protein